MAWNKRTMQGSLGNKEKYRFIFLYLNLAVAGASRLNVALVFFCGSSRLLRPPRGWQLWQMLWNHPAEEHQLPMPLFKSLQRSKSGLLPQNLSAKTELGYIYVIHLAPNITQTMHTAGSKLRVSVQFGHIKCSEYCGPLTNPKCCY